MKILSVIQRYGLDMRPINELYKIETSGYIKYNFISNDRLQTIFRYESELQNVLGTNAWIDSKNGLVSIYVPKKGVFPISSIITHDFYKNHSSVLKIALGETPDGDLVIGDLEKWVHVLIAGVPGSGKSTFLHVIINCLMMQKPEDVRMIMFDLKQVELMRYNELPHLLAPVITNIKKVEDELVYLISEMNRRYAMLRNTNCSNIQQYRSRGNSMPYLVVIIDELAEIILQDKDLEKQIIRLAQKGRACGIHLVIATQKPIAEVVTSLIKGNIDTRISFKVASHYDSMVILDSPGAEKLGKCGDMLLRDEDGLTRLQCCYISHNEIEQNILKYRNHITPEQAEVSTLALPLPKEEETYEMDRLYKQALELIMRENRCSAWLFMTELRIGRAKADMLIKKLQEQKIISQHKIGRDFKILKGVNGDA